MNALKAIFIICFLIYMLVYEIGFFKYYIYILLPYYVITQLLFFNSEYNTPKRKSLISMWCSPYDPQILGTLNVDAGPINKFLTAYSEKVGYKVSVTTFFLKVTALMMKQFQEINGNCVFGKFIPRDTVDISIYKLNKQGNSELVTVKNCDTKSLEDISETVKDKEKMIIEGNDSVHNRRHFFARILPHFALTPFVRTLSFLSNCGLDLSLFGYSKYGYGTCIVCPVKDWGIDLAYLPIPPYTYAPILLAINKTKKTNKIVDGNFIQEEKIKLNITMDHRYLDGSKAAKMAHWVDDICTHPEKFIN